MVLSTMFNTPLPFDNDYLNTDDTKTSVTDLTDSNGGLSDGAGGTNLNEIPEEDLTKWLE